MYTAMQQCLQSDLQCSVRAQVQELSECAVVHALGAGWVRACPEGGWPHHEGSRMRHTALELYQADRSLSPGYKQAVDWLG